MTHDRRYDRDASDAIALFGLAALLGLVAGAAAHAGFSLQVRLLVSAFAIALCVAGMRVLVQVHTRRLGERAHAQADAGSTTANR